MGVNVGFSIDKNSTMGQSETHVSPRIAAWAAYHPSDKILARAKITSQVNIATARPVAILRPIPGLARLPVAVTPGLRRR